MDQAVRANHTPVTLAYVARRAGMPQRQAATVIPALIAKGLAWRGPALPHLIYSPTGDGRDWLDEHSLASALARSLETGRKR